MGATKGIREELLKGREGVTMLNAVVSTLIGVTGTGTIGGSWVAERLGSNPRVRADQVVGCGVLMPARASLP